VAAGSFSRSFAVQTESMNERIPISIVTGFLGSGKTTLIAALLK
jgi:predicted ATPase